MAPKPEGLSLAEAKATEALTLKRRGRLKEAADLLRNVLELAPGWGSAWNDLGTVYGAQKDTERALEAFEQALKLDPGLLALVTANSVGVRKEAGLLGARHDELVELDKRGELSVEELFELGWVLRWQGHEARAKQVYVRFVEQARPEHRQLVAQLLPWLYKT
ncbi:MAG: tetratricopeptide repeat protein [Polyangiaceae bacterium]